MKSKDIRQKFLDFFQSKQHKIVPSAPIVNKDDPTLMFTNAGMNQFKDFFLGNRIPTDRRTADTQKCLRVSGKHNDLEEVGIDSYHHTMFEMLGNWSFGDYFKEEAIDWAWELLTKELGLDPNRLYASVFEGDEADGLEPDREALHFWKKYLPEERILFFDKKDNFWEMGDTGPCGPCSEIHIDLRSDEDRAKVDGATLVNMDDPEVIEIWNLVFIQFERVWKKNGASDLFNWEENYQGGLETLKKERPNKISEFTQLKNLPEKHIDTGMGFERLTMALQGKKSNYETDIFMPFINYLEKKSGYTYSNSYDLSAKSDIAMRVVVDHVRAVAFTIADGQLPSNTGAGYVIRRILRRAVRYYYSFLNLKSPVLHELVGMLAEEFKEVFPELKAQEDFVAKVVLEEERGFLRTLESGLKRIENLAVKNNQVAGETAFELLDTYGFPIDLTRLIAAEKGWTVDEAGYEKALAQQKERSRADAKKEMGDWTDLLDDPSVAFVGYDDLVVTDTKVVKHRTVKIKDKPQYQIVLSKTPFYAESGGQRGDVGLMFFGEEKIPVIDTQKENDLIIHVVKKFPADFSNLTKVEVHAGKRAATEKNHTAVHLMHAALHEVLGEHALQKGQDVDSKRLRFDFSHFQKVTDEEIDRIEKIVNQKIRANIPLEEERNMPISEAKALGATMLFGEKYGETVRVITFDKNFSQELCGGTHVDATGKIGLFKILKEDSVAAGVRRIEAVTANEAEAFVTKELQELESIRNLFKNPTRTVQNVEALQEENRQLKKEIEKLQAAQASGLKDDLKSKAEQIDGINFIASTLPLNDSKTIKTLAYELEREVGDALIVFGAEVNGKPQLMVTISENLTKEKDLHAGNMVRELAKEIKGGGGGQPFFATAGGKDVSGLANAIAKAREMLN
ncbi:MAG: alanine--tRNA ligase [Bacteroidota bacterium]